MTAIHQYTETLYVQNCITCGVPFGLPQSLDTALRNSHKSFFCPNGHSQVYTAESEEEKLRKQLAERDRLLQVRNTQLDDARKLADTLERSNRAVKAHVKRVKTRAAAGVCPAGCKRHVTNLQRHIATKHPTWKAEDESHG